MDHKLLDEEYLDFCSRQLLLSEHTLRSYEHVVRQFWQLMDQQFKVKGPHDVTKDMARSYLRLLTGMYKVSSAKHHFGVIKKYFAYLEEIEVISASPFTSIKARMKAEKKSPDSMNMEDVRKILSAAYAGHPETERETFIYYRNCAVLEFLFGTGMRIQELCSLSVSDIDAASGTVSVLGKGLRHRKCYLSSDQMYDTYQHYLDLRKKYMKKRNMRHDNAFINKEGKPLSTQAARNIVEKYVHAAGISKHVTPHSFRHTFASLLLEQGVELSYIQMYLGHSSISTTQIYLHISEKNAMEVLREHHPRKLMDTVRPDTAE